MDPAALLEIDDVVFLSGKASSMRSLRVRMEELKARKEGAEGVVVAAVHSEVE